MIRHRHRPGTQAHPQPQTQQSPSLLNEHAVAESTLSATPVPAKEQRRTAAKMASGTDRPRPSSSSSPSSDERRPLLQRDASERDDTAPIEDGEDDNDDNDGNDGKMGWVRQNKWIVLAIASGACAAFNGVFAKLTTTELTTSFAQGVARVLHLDSAETVIEYIVRAMFFGLNLLFNGIMWTLFTQALAKGHSTTQVSIMNTSSNFVITAMLGLMIFSESLPPLWWVGAALLIAGNVIIGSKDESGKEPGATEGGSGGVVAPAPGLDGLGDYEDVPQIDGILGPDEDKGEDEDIMELGELRD